MIANKVIKIVILKCLSHFEMCEITWGKKMSSCHLKVGDKGSVEGQMNTLDVFLTYNEESNQFEIQDNTFEIGKIYPFAVDSEDEIAKAREIYNFIDNLFKHE